MSVAGLRRDKIFGSEREKTDQTVLAMSVWGVEEKSSYPEQSEAEVGLT